MKELLSMLSAGRKLVPDKYRSKPFVFVFICIAVALDEFSVSGALTTSYSIAEHFHATTSTVSWVLSAYALTLGAFVILFGRLADILGPDKVFLAGVLSQALFSLLCAIPQPSIIAMIVFRAFQGIGGATLIPSGISIATHYFEGKALQLALGLISIVLTASFGVGCVMGGAFSLTPIGYQGFWYCICGIAVFCLFFLYLFMIPIEQTDEAKEMKVKDLDYPGVFFLVGGLLLIIFGLTESAEGWKDPKVYVPIPVGAVMVIGMFMFESFYIGPIQAKHAIEEKEVEPESQTTNGDSWVFRVQIFIPQQVFKLENFFSVLICLFVAYLYYISVLYCVIDYHIYVVGDSPLMASVKILPFIVGVIITPFIYNHELASKLGIKYVLVLSGLLELGCTVWLSRLDYRIADEYWKFEFVSLFIIGLNQNVIFLVYFNTVVVDTPLHLQGVVSGVVLTFGQIGVALGGAIFSTVIGNITTPTTPDQVLALHKHMRNAFYLPIAAYALYILVCMTVKNPKKRQEVSRD